MSVVAVPYLLLSMMLHVCVCVCVFVLNMSLSLGIKADCVKLGKQIEKGQVIERVVHAKLRALCGMFSHKKKRDRTLEMLFGWTHQSTE